jgi:hypothetical protein
MFRWPRRRGKDAATGEPVEAERDSGEEEVESADEADLEIDPLGQPRIKTDDI